jgi:MFS family permease
VLAAHQIVLRVGWMFKTESVIMPAFLDAVSGAGWLRGCLPVLSRLGQSVPPVFCAERLKETHYKKHVLAALTLLMAVPFGVLAAVCFATAGQTPKPFWMSGLFLALYFAFFVGIGLYLMVFGTLQGKLIRPARRGRLLLLSTFCGTIPAIAVAVWLMPRWLDAAAPNYGMCFATVAICFFFSGLIILFAFEPADGTAGPIDRRRSVSEMFQTLRRDANLRRLALVVMLANSGMLLTPHYQALAREMLGLGGVHLVYWIIAQSASVGILSVLVGPLADRRGNRLTMQLLIVASAIAPAFAILLPHLGAAIGGKLFWAVFVTFGVIPLVQRIVVNYTLEICEPDQHARYLSTVSLCGAVPFLLAPAIGGLVDAVGFEWVFMATVCLILLGGLVSLRLEEPRHRIPPEEAATIGIAADE